MMIELRGGGAHKGDAIRRLMNADRMAGIAPVMIGDDLTDEGGFVAAADLSGFGILVGPDRPTGALYRLEDVAAVREWLGGVLA
jgi:trehalose 6-phosphate phosphatase